jgi:RNA polymerase sigma-70 factor, ECF subfamily
VLLEDQDRSAWDRAEIEEGLALTERLNRRGGPGPYGLQAAIAAEHARAARPQDTDWAAIANLYGMLAGTLRSPVVELNRAVAVAMADGPDAGLRLIDALAEEGSLDR